MNLSLAITTYNRFELTVKSFEKVVDDERISDILLLDDASTDDSYKKLMSYFAGHPKVRVMGKLANSGMATNKRDSVAWAKEDWIILFDSDNVIGPDYLDALYSVNDVMVEESEIFMPDKALPNFDYSFFDGESLHRNNINVYSSHQLFGAILNTSNYVVNKKFFLETWQFNPDVKGCDTIWHAYRHFERNGSFYVVPNMTYNHLVHSGSEYAKDMEYNLQHSKRIEIAIKAL